MKFTLSWLKRHLDTSASLDALSDRLTAIGLEVEAIEDRGAALDGFVVAEVKEARQHPNADRLRVCKVDAGTGTLLNVVCGAPNARAGMKAVFAPAGVVIPATRKKLEKGVIRGEESNGMLCSSRELELGDDHDGIIDLVTDLAPGTPAAAALGLEDPVIEIALTPNRGDCAGVLGVARDLAAAGIGTLKPLEAKPVPASFKSTITSGTDDEQACPLFLGRLIRGVKNGASPAWLQDWLRAVGLRPISALVDITNFFTLDASRPLHVFDAAKLTGDRVFARRARDGETVAALNGKTYELTREMTVIADASGALGIAGIMGGESTSVSEATTDVFVECALFDPVRTAATGRALQIMSDARYRFERGVDPAFARPGLELATQMIVDLCGGSPGEITVGGREQVPGRTIEFRPERVLGLGGVDVPLARQQQILTALGCKLSSVAGGGSTVTVPSWRPDLAIEADLVEEVLRIEGYDKIPSVMLPRLHAVTRTALDNTQRRAVAARRALALRGLSEAVTWSFLDRPTAEMFGAAPDELRLINPIAADLDQMRPSILPNLLRAASRNAARGFADVGLFEVGPVYRDASPTGQDRVAAIVRAGSVRPRWWRGKAEPADLFAVKADALAALAAIGAPTANLNVTADAPAWFHPGRSGTLRLGPTVLAVFGELHPTVLEALELQGPAAAAELWIDRAPASKKKGTATTPLALSPFQPVRRDFAFLVDDGVTSEALLKAVRQADKDLIVETSLFDVYQGTNVPAGKKSMAVEVVLQPMRATLTDAEIEAIAAKVVAAAAKLGATLRS
jgi:phenylalanyl-tRNA synthetase beta chain